MTKHNQTIAKAVIKLKQEIDELNDNVFRAAYELRVNDMISYSKRIADLEETITFLNSLMED